MPPPTPVCTWLLYSYIGVLHVFHVFLIGWSITVTIIFRQPSCDQGCLLYIRIRHEFFFAALSLYVLYYTTLYSTILYYTLHYTILYYTILYTTLYYTILYYYQVKSHAEEVSRHGEAFLLTWRPERPGCTEGFYVLCGRIYAYPGSPHRRENLPNQIVTTQ